VPKSSSETFTPRSRNWRRIARVVSVSCSSTDSVISISRRSGARPDAASASLMARMMLL
jgi:hypothetical protein